MEDPRCNIRNQVDYTVTELMFLTISAVVCGMDQWQEIHEFGLYRLDWLRKYFPFKNGSPHPSTLSRFFASLDSETFGAYFMEWMEEIAKISGGQVVAIDGKTMRGSADPEDNKAALHIVSAFVSHQSVCLSIIRITADRLDKKTGKAQHSERYYISSKKASAKVFNKDIRSHWAIENTLHWSLDVNYREDSSKKRKGNSAQNMGLFAKMALNLIKQKPDKKAKSIRARRLKALMSPEYREDVLGI